MLAPESVTVGAATRPRALSLAPSVTCRRSRLAVKSLTREATYSASGFSCMRCLSASIHWRGADVRDTLSAILTQEPREIPVDSPVPLDLRDVVWKCLEKDKTSALSNRRGAFQAVGWLRRRRDTRSPAAGAPVPLPPALAAIGTDGLFVGRDPEQRSLAAAWEHSESGQRSLVLIAGEAGIGKTRLCAEFARSSAAEGATVLAGRSDEQALLPYQPFIEALQWYVTMCPQPDLLTQLSEMGGGAELRLLLPELVRRVPALPALTPMIRKVNASVCSKR